MSMPRKISKDGLSEARESIVASVVSLPLGSLERADAAWNAGAGIGALVTTRNMLLAEAVSAWIDAAPDGESRTVTAYCDHLEATGQGKATTARAIISKARRVRDEFSEFGTDAQPLDAVPFDTLYAYRDADDDRKRALLGDYRAVVAEDAKKAAEKVAAPTAPTASEDAPEDAPEAANVATVEPTEPSEVAAAIAALPEDVPDRVRVTLDASLARRIASEADQRGMTVDEFLTAAVDAFTRPSAEVPSSAVRKPRARRGKGASA